MDPKMDSGMEFFEWKMLNFTDKAKLTQVLFLNNFISRKLKLFR